MIIIIVLAVSAVFYLCSSARAHNVHWIIARIMFLLQGFPKGFLWHGADQPGGTGMHENDSAHISMHSSPALLQALNG